MVDTAGVFYCLNLFYFIICTVDTQNVRDMSTPKYDQETEQTRKMEEGEEKAEHLNDLDHKRIDIDSKEEENDPANVGKAGHGRIKINVAENTTGKTGADESATGSKKRLSIHYYYYCEVMKKLVEDGVIGREFLRNISL